MDIMRGVRNEEFKRKSSTIDKKSLRVHRRSMDWIEHRNDEVNRRRNFEDMSPVVEENLTPKTSPTSSPAPKSTPSRMRGRTGTPKKLRTPKRTKGCIRYEQLLRWKQEKELKKKLEAEKKKPTFKVCRVKPDVAPFMTNKGQTVKTEVNKGKSKVKESAQAMPQRSLRSHSKVAVDPSPTTVTRSTRSARDTHQKKDEPVEKSAPAGLQRSLRSHSKVKVDPPATAVIESTRSARHAHNKKDEPAPTRNGRTTRAPANPPVEKFTRLTRSQTQTKTTGDHFKPVERKPKKVQKKKSHLDPIAVHEESATAETANNTVPFNVGRITTERGQSATLQDFNLTIPESFVFTPMSPESAANFLFPNSSSGQSFMKSHPPRRCSTPKFAGLVERKDKLSRTPVQSRLKSNITEGDESETKKALGSDLSSSDKQGNQNCSTQQQTPQESGEVFFDEEGVAAAVPDKPELGSGEDDTPKDEMGEAKNNSDSIEQVNDGAFKTETAGCVDNVMSQQVGPQTEQENGIQRRRSTRRSVRLAEEKVSDPVNAQGSNQLVTSPKVLPVKTDASPSQGTKNDEEGMEVSSERNDEVRSSEAAIVSTVENSSKSPPSRRRSARRSLAKSISSFEFSEESKSVLILSDDAAEEHSESGEANKRKIDPEEEESVTKEGDVTGTPRTSTHLTRKSMSCMAEFVQPTPGSCGRKSSRKRRKSMATNQDKIKSPEEWVKVLAQSPMVEMSRRTPKSKTPPEKATLSLAIDFEDMDGIDIVYPQPEGKDQEFKPSDSFIELTGSREQGQDQQEEVNPEDMETDENKENNIPLLEATTSAAEIKHDVKYFRNLIESERKRLTDQCKTWDEVNDSDSELTEEVKGEIRTTVGQAQLLMDQRFKQFSGLVDNCEFGIGEKETTCTDLEGFWDMIFFQVEDVDKKFEDLEKRKAANWVVEDGQKPGKPKAKKKNLSKTAKSKPAVKSKFAAFRAQMMKQKKQEEKQSEKSECEKTMKVFDAGFFVVSSPSKTPSPHCAAGSTPSRSVPEVKEVVPISPVAQPVPACTREEQSVYRHSLSTASTPIPPVLNVTPRRRSYVPTVPSPLLCDITPSRAKRRRSYRNTPLPKKLMKRSDGSSSPCITDSDVVKDVLNNSPAKTSPTPVRRTRHRSNKSVSFGETLMMASPDRTSLTDENDFTNSDMPNIDGNDQQNRSLRSLSFCDTVSLSTLDDKDDTLSTSVQTEDHGLGADNCLLPYTLPSAAADSLLHDDASLNINTSVKEDSIKEEKPKSALKRKLQPGQRRSARLSVHFAASPDMPTMSAPSLPQTPFNYNSLVPKRRTRSASFTVPEWDDDTESGTNKHVCQSPLNSNGKENISFQKDLFPANSLSSPLRTNNRQEMAAETCDLISFSPW